MKHDRQNFLSLPHHQHHHLNNQENQNFEKLKNAPGDIIILQMCTINENHMMYGSSDMDCDGQHFLSFWTIF